MSLKEADIVRYVVNHFNKFFPDLDFCKTEYSLRDFRVDILASFEANLKDLNVRDEDYICRPAVFIEVKYKSKMRDLLHELNKQLEFQKWYLNTAKAFCLICVLSDSFNETDIKFMESNSIIMYKYSYINDDLSTLKIEEYNSSKYKIEQEIYGDESKIKKTNKK